MADSFKRRGINPAGVVSGAVALVVLAGAASGETPSVAIVSAASNNATQNTNYKADVQAKIAATGLFATVDVIDAGALAGATPTLAQLQQYSAVLTFSNGDYADSAALGNLLADYVDSGGGVVVAEFANVTPTVARRLEGRWRTGTSYEILNTGSFSTGAASLGTVLIPGHPTMTGVNTFTGGSVSLRPSATTTMASHGQVVTQWSDGKTLIAVSTLYPGRADLGMLPMSSDVSSSSWAASTDGGRIMANALLYVSHPHVACYANCDASTSAPILNVSDFSCFLQKYASGDAYANCDGSTQAPVLNVTDFSCFLQKYAAGCP